MLLSSYYTTNIFYLFYVNLTLIIVPLNPFLRVTRLVPSTKLQTLAVPSDDPVTTLALSELMSSDKTY